MKECEWENEVKACMAACAPNACIMPCFLFLVGVSQRVMVEGSSDLNA